MKKWFQTNKFYLIGAVMGALSGFLYWKFIGCSTGTCAITSNPFRSSIYFAVLGALVVGSFKKEKQFNATGKDQEL